MGRGDRDEGVAYTAPSPANFGPASLTYSLSTPYAPLWKRPSDFHQGLERQKPQLGASRTKVLNTRERIGYVPVLTVRCELVTVTVACSPREMLGREGDV